MPINVFLITDHCLLGRAIEQFIAGVPQRFTVVGSAGTAAAAAPRLAALATDIILFDMDGKSEEALPALTLLRHNSGAKVLVLTRFDDSAQQDQMVMGGARGVLDRHSMPETLLSAIEKVHEGQFWLDRAATGRIFVAFSQQSTAGKPADAAAKRHQLTEREHEIVEFIAHNHGEPGKVIASKLHISESTLRNHLTSIYEKLGVTNRPGLLAYAFQHGLAAAPQRQAS